MKASLRRRLEALEAAHEARGGGIDWEAEEQLYGRLLWREGLHRAYAEYDGEVGRLTLCGGPRVLVHEVHGVDLTEAM